jgi:hypothetical protein
MAIDVETFRSIIEDEKEGLPPQEQQIIDEATSDILMHTTDAGEVDASRLHALFDAAKIDRGAYKKDSPQYGLSVGYGLQSLTTRNVFALLCLDTSNTGKA